MFYEKELKLLQKMLDNYYLQNLIINSDDPLDERIDKGLRKLFTDYDKNNSFSDYFPDIESNTVYHITDIFYCRYVFFKLPFISENKIFIIGPYTNADISHSQILEQTEKWNLPTELADTLVKFYSSITAVRDENNIFALTNAFSETVWGGQDKYKNISISFENPSSFLPSKITVSDIDSTGVSDLKIMEERYKFENELITAVSQGNLRKAEQMFSIFSSLAFERRVSDPLRNLKNYCIVMNTLFRKAAESGGVHPYYLDNVSSNIAKRTETIRSLSEIPAFMAEVLSVYCSLVRKHSVKSFSPLVQKVIIMIESNLANDLSLAALAKAHSISPAYLSGIFKKETGETLTEFVNSKRIDYAKTLLKNTNLQVQTIAQHCGILDIHYFCRVFKKFTGKTPKEYRNSVFVM